MVKIYMEIGVRVIMLTYRSPWNFTSILPWIWEKNIYWNFSVVFKYANQAISN